VKREFRQHDEEDLLRVLGAPSRLGQAFRDQPRGPGKPSDFSALCPARGLIRIRYEADITAGGLKLLESKLIADLLLRQVDSKGWRDAVMTKNAFRVRNPATALTKRFYNCNLNQK
jgi:hypothetical protein